MKPARIILSLTALLLTVWGCHRDSIGGDVVPQGEENGLIPATCVPRVYIDTPGGKEITSKANWVELATIRIEADIEGNTQELYKADSLKIKGRGNSTWLSYPKKPYSLKLKHKANFLGTGKTSRWVLLANWMDRTNLRNDVAFEAARRTSMEWAASGTFVELYMNQEYRGLYWLGERIHVEGSNFLADYLYSFDTSDKSEMDFATGFGRRGNLDGEIPVEVKYPDRDDYPNGLFAKVIEDAANALDEVEYALYKTTGGLDKVDIDSFCDWLLVHEICNNGEPKYPKSSFFYLRDGKLYAGPVWDFDFGTFTCHDNHPELINRRYIYYHQLWAKEGFTKRLKSRWLLLKPAFESLTQYIDKRAALIRGEVEERDHEMWPCGNNPLSDPPGSLVNGDENLSFDEAVQLMKSNLLGRIAQVDVNIRNLQ